MQVTTYYQPSLWVLNPDSGWSEFAMSGSPVSPRSVEAMNLILEQDGILACIATKDEFGDFLQFVSTETGKDTSHCWISLPALTILGILGLSARMGLSERSEVIFHGSPLTTALTALLWALGGDIEDHPLEHLPPLEVLLQAYCSLSFEKMDNGYMISLDLMRCLFDEPSGPRWISDLEFRQAYAVLYAAWKEHHNA